MSSNYNQVPKRSEIKIGAPVRIAQKQHYESGEITDGTVAQILTSKDDHPRGIKVRLTSGIIGRVQALGGQSIRPIEEADQVVPTNPINYSPSEDELL